MLCGYVAERRRQITLSASDADYLDQLIPAIRRASASNDVSRLEQCLSQISEQREAQIERMCNTNHQEFISSVDHLLRVREGTGQLTSEILKLNESIQTSTERLLEQKRALVESRNVRQNIDEATQALNNCLEVLRLANHVHELLAKKNHYGALRALDELQNVHLRQITRYKLADLIQGSVPATQKLISDAVMTDLNTWLYWIRETSQFLGEVAFYHTELRRTRQKDRAEKTPHLGNVKLNSAIELVADETEEFDLLDNDEVQVDFSPLFECLHIHEALGRSDKFRAEYAATRRQQKELLLPPSVTLVDENDTSLSALLEGIAGFAIVEKVTMKKVQNLRSPVDVSHACRIDVCGAPRCATVNSGAEAMHLSIGGGILGIHVPNGHCFDFQGLGHRGQHRIITQDQRHYCVIHPDHGGKSLTIRDRSCLGESS